MRFEAGYRPRSGRPSPEELRSAPVPDDGIKRREQQNRVAWTGAVSPASAENHHRSALASRQEVHAGNSSLLTEATEAMHKSTELAWRAGERRNFNNDRRSTMIERALRGSVYGSGYVGHAQANPQLGNPR